MSDEQEFNDAAESTVKLSRSETILTLDELFGRNPEPKIKEIGQPSQYANYAGGYLPTTTTVATLPAGAYEIVSGEMGPYATLCAPPTGLLLELPEMKSDTVIKIVDTFWASEKDYKEGSEFVIGGAAFKAGIMLFGPPGSGKSCTIKLVSRRLIQAGGTVFFGDAHPGIIHAFLTRFYKIENQRKCIVIFEDIDSLINQYGESAYLDLLDSAKTIDNVMFIATTNYPDRLDPRIYNRPGRFSHVVKIGLPGQAARRAYLKAVLKNHRDVEYIVAKSEGFTIDHLSALTSAVYREKKDLETEIARLRTLFKVPTVEDKSIGIGG
jgi:hypothetical protein